MAEWGRHYRSADRTASTYQINRQLEGDHPRQGQELGGTITKLDLEVLATQIAVALEVPCAETMLCLRDGRRGSLSRSVVTKGHSLVNGVVVLGAAFGGVPRADEATGAATAPKRERTGHSLANIRTALEGMSAPVGFGGPPTAFTAFATYMVLDAVIANPDRHEENWSVLRPELGQESASLAPSYDHASSLGHNLQDPYRERVLTASDGLVKWAARGRATRFAHSGQALTLVDHATAAVELCSAEGADWIRHRLAGVNFSDVLASLDRHQIEGMSDLAATFAIELIALNLRRLRDVTGTNS